MEEEDDDDDVKKNESQSTEQPKPLPESDLKEQQRQQQQQELKQRVMKRLRQKGEVNQLWLETMEMWHDKLFTFSATVEFAVGFFHKKG